MHLLCRVTEGGRGYAVPRRASFAEVGDMQGTDGRCNVCVAVLRVVIRRVLLLQVTVRTTVARRMGGCIEWRSVARKEDRDAGIQLI